MAKIFISGPSASATVSGMEHVEPIIAALCAYNGDDPDEYTATDISALAAQPATVPEGWLYEFSDPDPQYEFEKGERCPRGWVGKARPLFGERTSVPFSADTIVAMERAAASVGWQVLPHVIEAMLAAAPQPLLTPADAPLSNAAPSPINSHPEIPDSSFDAPSPDHSPDAGKMVTEAQAGADDDARHLYAEAGVPDDGDPSPVMVHAAVVSAAEQLTEIAADYLNRAEACGATDSIDEGACAGGDEPSKMLQQAILYMRHALLAAAPSPATCNQPLQVQPEAQAGADDDELELQARELLAAEWRASGHDDMALRLVQPRLLTTDNPAVRAIMAALRKAKPAPVSGGVGARTEWMIEASRLLDEAGHGIHAAALATLAEGIRIGRVVNAPAPAGEAVAWMTPGKSPFFCETKDEAAEFCSGTECPIPLYTGPTAAGGEAPWREVLREYQDGRRISNVHTRQVARDIEQEIARRLASAEGGE